MDFSFFLHLIAALLVFYAIRLLPLYGRPPRGPDAHYFLLCVEALKKSKKIPIVLPEYFLLEEKIQAYPPGFTIFLSFLPERWLAGNYWMINNLLDGIVGAAMWCVVFFLANEWAAWMALVMYAINPALFNEYQCMTSRSLASMLFALFLGLTWLSVSVSWWFFAPAIAVGCVLVYTHKLTMQMCWLLYPAFSLLRVEAGWFFVLIASYLAAFAVNPFFFQRLMDGHFQYVRFWTRKWPLLGAHQVKHSPIYGDPDDASGLFYGETGVKLLWKNVRRMLIACPWFVPGAAATLTLGPEAHGFWAQFNFVVFTGGLCTLVVPFLRGVGEGTKYVKYITPVALILCAQGVAHGSYLVVALCVLIGVFQLHQYKLAIDQLDDKENQAGVISDKLAPVIESLKGMERARVLSIPQIFGEHLAYSTRKSFLQGGHSSGIENVVPCFPVFTKPVEQLVEEFSLTHLVLDSDYATLEELRLHECVSPVVSSGTFTLFAFKE